MSDHMLSPEQLRQVQLRVAERARGAEDCRTVLAMLGLLDQPETSAPTRGSVCRDCRRPMMPNLTPGRIPDGWIRQKTGNQCVPCYKRAHKPATAPAAAPEKTIVAQAVRRRSGCRATDLGFQTRVAELRAVQGRTWPQIAAELGCAAGTARSAYEKVLVQAVTR